MSRGSFLPFGVLFTGMVINQIFFWCTNQSIIQRALGARNLKEAQKGVLIAAVFKILGPIAIVLPGVIAYHMFKESLTGDQYLQAYPLLVKTVLPTVLTGVFAAVMVGAVLSTFNSVLNSAATLYGNGVHNQLINKRLSARAQVRVGRWCSAILAVAAMVMAPMIDTSGSLYIYLQQINATFFGPMLAVILCGLMTTSVSAPAAKVGLVAGPVVFYLLNFAFGDEYQRLVQAWFGLAEPIHFLHTLAVVFVITIVLMIGISFLRPATESAEREIDEMPQAVDLTPWRYSRVAGVLITATAIGCYVILAQ